MFNEIGKVVILFGAVLVVLGLILTSIPAVRLGRLPGDVFIRKDNWSLYIPITTSIVLSVVLSLLFWIIAYLRR